MRMRVQLLCTVFLLFSPSVFAQSHVEREQWAKDVATLSEQLPKLHKNAFHFISKVDFDAEISRLQHDLPVLNRDQFVTRLVQIVASIHDGHTAIPVTALADLRFHILPLRLYLYGDGLYIQGIDKKYEQAIGGKVVSIGKFSARDLYDKVATLVPADNEQTTKERITQYMIVPELLHGLGAIEDAGVVPMVVEVGAEQKSMNMSPVPMPRFDEPGIPVSIPLSGNWVDARDKGERPPLWLRHPEKEYWMEFLPERKTLYVQYSKCASSPDEPIGQFGQRMLRFIDENPVEKLVLDLRLNAGGEGFLNNSLLLPLIQARKINQRGKLFVLIGRRTFSAAQVLSNQLEFFTPATFVGEPTGSSPHFYGNHKMFLLPGLHLPVMVSPTWWQSQNPQDERPWIAPRIAVDMTIADYKANRDPVLDSVFTFEPLEAFVTKRWTTGTKADLTAISAEYNQLPMNRYADLQAEWNSLGYGYLRANDTSRAITVFELNVQLHSHSMNAFDSLGDAYAAAGRKQEAIAAYKNALRINPHFGPSQASLERLEHEGAAPTK